MHLDSREELVLTGICSRVAPNPITSGLQIPRGLAGGGEKEMMERALKYKQTDEADTSLAWSRRCHDSIDVCD